LGGVTGTCQKGISPPLKLLRGGEGGIEKTLIEKGKALVEFEKKSKDEKGGNPRIFPESRQGKKKSGLRLNPGHSSIEKRT